MARSEDITRFFFIKAKQISPVAEKNGKVQKQKLVLTYFVYNIKLIKTYLLSLMSVVFPVNKYQHCKADIYKQK